MGGDGGDGKKKKKPRKQTKAIFNLSSPHPIVPESTARQLDLRVESYFRRFGVSRRDNLTSVDWFEGFCLVW